jgi:hypothetical protein
MWNEFPHKKTNNPAPRQALRMAYDEGLARVRKINDLGDKAINIACLHARSGNHSMNNLPNKWSLKWQYAS